MLITNALFAPFSESEHLCNNEGSSKMGPLFQYWLSFSESGGRGEKERERERDSTAEGRETYDRLSHV